MLIDLHTHTSRYSACSVLAPDDLCRLSAERGLDAIVITEHFALWGTQERNVLQRKFPQLRIFRGVEISVREGYDVICITAEEKLEVMSMLSVLEVRELLGPALEKSFLFVAHPFRFNSELTPGLQTVLRNVDGIEMNSINIFKKDPVKSAEGWYPRNRQCYIRALEDYPLIPLYNTDTHHPYSVGGIASYLETDVVPEDETALASLLRRTPAVERQNPEVIERFLRAYGA